MTIRARTKFAVVAAPIAGLAGLAAIGSAGLLAYALGEFGRRCRGQELSGLGANDCGELQIFGWVTGLAAVLLAGSAVLVWRRARRTLSGPKGTAHA